MIAKPNTAACVAFFWLFSCSSSLAQSWDNEVGDADWFSQTNWNTDILPDGTQDVFIDTSGETVLITDQDPDAAAQARDMFLGSTAGANGELTIESGGTLENRQTFVGLHPDATGQVTVTGTGSEWNSTGIGGAIHLGTDGSTGGGQGHVLVEDGAALNTGYAYIGSYSLQESTLRVSGTDTDDTPSSLTAQQLYVGTGSLTVDQGAAVTTDHGYVGYNGNGTSTALVDGAGTLWSNSTALAIGVTNDAQLTISAGATVTSLDTFLGSSSGTQGTVIVTGASSTLSNSRFMYLGESGTGMLYVEDGGTVVSDGAVYVGFQVGSTGGIEVTGSGSSLTSANAVLVGWGGSGSLAVSQGATVTASTVGVGNSSGAHGVATVSGSGSSLMTDQMAVGGQGPGSLTIEDGGIVDVTGLLRIGSLISASESYVRVTGADSTLRGGQIFIESPKNATLVIDDGGLVEVDGGNGIVEMSGFNGLSSSLIIGADPNLPGYDPLTDLTAPGTLNAAEVDFGDGTNGDGTNTLIFNHSDDSGNYTFSPDLTGGSASTIEHLAGHTNLTGDGSGFTGETYVEGGTLAVTDGGMLGGSAGYVGYAPGSDGAATVSGAGSNWTTTSDIAIGFEGAGSLYIEDGGTVGNTNGYIAYSSGSNGSVSVSGPGSAWTNSGYMHVGYFGTGTLTIEDGGAVSNTYGYIGYFPGGDGTVTVSGSGSTWMNSEFLMIGGDDKGTLIVENGGAVSNTIGLVGVNSGSTGAVTVGGSGSIWTSSGDMFIGSSGTGSLTVKDDGLVDVAGTTRIAQAASSLGTLNIGAASGEFAAAPGTLDTPLLAFGSGDGTLVFNHTDTTGVYEFAVPVSGSGTIEHHAGYTNLTGDGSGFAGETYVEGGTLAVIDGGSLAGTDGYIGSAPGFDGSAVVSGTGSSWTNTNNLTIGDEGGGSLSVSDGGLVTVDRRIYIGKESTSEGLLAISGQDSAVETYFLYAGTAGKGTVLVSDGGSLETEIGYIAQNGGSQGKVTVTGAGSTWTSHQDVYIGKDGNGELIIESGGVVAKGYAHLGGGNGTQGILTVTGTGSEWSNMEYASIGDGDGSYGIVTIEDGGVISGANQSVYVGFGTDSDGTVTVDGSGSAWNGIKDLILGIDGTGTLTIADGGLVSGNNDAIITLNAPSSGAINIGAAAGDTARAPGTLDMPGVIFYYGTGKLVFNHTDETGDYEFAPNIASDTPGTATIEHHAGFTRLTGDGSDYVQTTDIHGGTLAIDNVLGGQVNVLGGGTLGGSGLANGDVSFNSGSYYLVEMDGTTGTQGLTVEGTAALTGGTVMIEGEYTAIAGAGPIVIMTTDTALATTFDGAVTPSVFYTPTLSYEMDGGTDYVFVSIEQDVLFSDLADTQNRRSVAGALDGLPGGHPLASALLLLGTEEAARDAYDQLSGEAHASLKGALVENGQRAVRAVNDRIHSAFEAGDANTSVSAYGDLADPANGFWMTGYGDWMTTDATGNTHAFDNDLYGVIAGIDRRFGDYGRLGVLGGYSRTNTSIDALASEADADSYTVGVYGGADNGNAAISLGALYTWHSIESTRHVTNPVTEMLAADYDARSFQLFAEAGYKATMDRLTLEPFAGVSYINLNTDAFSETGGSAALSSPSETTSTTFTTLGLRSSIELASNVSTRGMVGWRHAFGDVDPSSTFTIGGSGPFSILGAPIAQDAAVVEAGIDIAAGDNVSIGASYEGQYGDGAIANGFNARLLAEF